MFKANKQKSYKKIKDFFFKMGSNCGRDYYDHEPETTMGSCNKKSSKNHPGIKVYLNNPSIVGIDDNSEVRIQFVGRHMAGPVILMHMAWLFECEHFYATIEYGKSGILVQYYPKSWTIIDDAYKNLIGDFDYVFYNDDYSTKKKFLDILLFVVEKTNQFNCETFSLRNNNCKHFASELGKFLDPSFDLSESNIPSWQKRNLS